MCGLGICLKIFRKWNEGEYGRIWIFHFYSLPKEPSVPSNLFSNLSGWLLADFTLLYDCLLARMGVPTIDGD